ncbi:hypothetical protein D3C84_565330 [compost metagenome]
MLGVAGQGEGARFGAGKGAGLVQQTAVLHHLARGLQNQRHQAGMEVLVDHQGGHRRQGDGGLRRAVQGQVEQTLVDGYALEKWQARLVGGGATKVGQA